MALSRLAFLAHPAGAPFRRPRVRPVMHRCRPSWPGAATIVGSTAGRQVQLTSSSSSSSSSSPSPSPSSSSAAASPSSPSRSTAPALTDRERVLQRQASIAGTHWARALRTGDTVVDATCGRGRDTLRLAQMLALASSHGTAGAGADGDPYAGGRVVAIDIQADAVAATEELVRTSLPDLVAQPQLPTVEYVRRSHESFDGLGLAPGSVGVIAYNLGYLPGQENVDRTVMTTAVTTVASLNAATELVRVGGLITVVCYCGHEGGAEEETAVTTWAAGLPKDRWSALAMTWLNRENSPSLLLVERTR